MAERICSMRGCEKKHRGRGLCGSHLAKARREGWLPPGQPTAPRHSLTNIDKIGRRADCTLCGPGSSIRVREDKRRPVECRGARKARRRKKRVSTYGLSLDDFNQLLQRQNGRCAICDTSERKLHVDHDHDTGKVRALLCPPCNRGLGHFRDQHAVVLAAATYLELHMHELDK